MLQPREFLDRGWAGGLQQCGWYLSEFAICKRSRNGICSLRGAAHSPARIADTPPSKNVAFLVGGVSAIRGALSLFFWHYRTFLAVEG